MAAAPGAGSGAGLTAPAVNLARPCAPPHPRRSNRFHLKDTMETPTGEGASQGPGRGTQQGGKGDRNTGLWRMYLGCQMRRSLLQAPPPSWPPTQSPQRRTRSRVLSSRFKSFALTPRVTNKGKDTGNILVRGDFVFLNGKENKHTHTFTNKASHRSGGRLCHWVNVGREIPSN